MTNKQITQGIKELAKTETQSAYKQKSQDHKGRFARARAAKESIRRSQGE